MDAGSIWTHTYVCHPLTFWSILVFVLSVNSDLYRLNSVPVDLIRGPGFRVCVCVLEMLSLFFSECLYILSRTTATAASFLIFWYALLPSGGRFLTFKKSSACALGMMHYVLKSVYLSFIPNWIHIKENKACEKTIEISQKSLSTLIWSRSHDWNTHIYKHRGMCTTAY